MEQVLNEARKWIGVKQGSAKHRELVNAYNSVSPKPRGHTLTMTDSWCDAFITVIFDKTGKSDLIGREVSVQRHIDIFKRKGIWIEDGRIKPKVGDIITYNWDTTTQPNVGWADHIGIVEKVGTKNITVIEGNISCTVGRRTLAIGHGTIRGYARPKYKTADKPTTTYTAESIANDIWTNPNHKWGVQPQRQKNIEKVGVSYKAVQDILNKKSKPTTKHTAQSIADDIWNNPNHKWGNQPKREKNIEAVGVSYKTVQDILNNKSKPTPKPSKTSGRWKFNTTVNIRVSPSTSRPRVGYYSSGQTVNILDIIEAEGYVWGHYISHSGYHRYVALGTINGNKYGGWV